MTQSDTYTNLAANISIAGTTATILPVTRQSWSSASGVLVSPTEIANVSFVGGAKDLTATLAEDCSSISWSNGDEWTAGDPRYHA